MLQDRTAHRTSDSAHPLLLQGWLAGKTAPMIRIKVVAILVANSYSDGPYRSDRHFCLRANTAHAFTRVRACCSRTSNVPRHTPLVTSE